MKRKFFEEHRSILKRISCFALAAVIAGTGFVAYRNTTVSDIPELVTFVDQETVEVLEDEVPLASKSKTTKKVTTKTTTEKTKMAKKAKKTKTTTKKKTKNSSKTTSNSIQKVQTKTKVVTTIKTKTKKNSKVKTTQTKVVTTVTTTTTQLLNRKYSKETAKTASKDSNTAAIEKAGTYSVRSVASAADARVLNAFEKIGCKVVVNPSVSYSGCFDARNRTITLKKLDATVYHELGHFVEFVGGTSAVKKSIASAYGAEKAKYTAANKAYVLQNSSEYFAESFKNYCENPAALKQARPMTYEAIVQALQVMTDSRVSTLIGVYKSVWK